MMESNNFFTESTYQNIQPEQKEGCSCNTFFLFSV